MVCIASKTWHKWEAVAALYGSTEGVLLGCPIAVNACLYPSAGCPRHIACCVAPWGQPGLSLGRGAVGDLGLITLGLRLGRVCPDFHAICDAGFDEGSE